MGVLYKLDFPNGKSYIGITKRTLKRRLREHFASSSRSLVSTAIRKYGKEKVRTSILFECSAHQTLRHLEMLTIRQLNTRSPNGYNLSDGGECCRGEEQADWESRQIRCVCEFCKSEFQVDPNRIVSGRGRFCSARCRYDAMLSGEEYTCATCGKIEYRSKCKLHRGDAQYCSRQCSSKAQNTKVAMECQFCKNKFNVSRSKFDAGEGRFCSRLCARTASRTQVSRTCEYCGGGFLAQRGSVELGKGRFCSKSCAGKHRESIKQKITNPNGYVCKTCGSAFNKSPSDQIVNCKPCRNASRIAIDTTVNLPHNAPSITGATQ